MLGLRLQRRSSHAQQRANERIVFLWSLSRALSGLNSQAIDELGVPQGPSIHLALGRFVRQTVNRWAFVPDPPHICWPTQPPMSFLPLQWQCAPENWYSHICVTSVLCLDLRHFYTHRRQRGENTPTGAFPLQGFEAQSYICELRIWEYVKVIVHRVVFFSTILVCRDGRALWKYLMFIKILGIFFSQWAVCELSFDGEA